MKLVLRTFGTIAGLLIPALLFYRHTTTALICLFSAILCFIISAISDRASEQNKASSQPSGGLKVTGVATDDNTRLVIKAICDESHGFVTINDIVRDTNLPLKIINKALDWLVINNFATETKGRNAEVYTLTSEGKSVFFKPH